MKPLKLESSIKKGLKCYLNFEVGMACDKYIYYIYIYIYIYIILSKFSTSNRVYQTLIENEKCTPGQR